MHLTELSIRRPVTVLMAMLMVILLGLVSYSRLQIDLLPEISPPVAAIITTFPGASATEVADLVTAPLEAAAVTTGGIKDIMSISQEGLSTIVLTFDWGQDMAEVRDDLAQKLELVSLPEDASEPTVIKYDPTMLPVMQISVTQSDSSDIAALTELANDILKPRLEGIEGVANVEVLGGRTKYVEVSLDPERMSEYGITQDTVAAVISASNLNYPLGTLEKDGLRLGLRLEGKLQSIQALENLVVAYVPRTVPSQAGQVVGGAGIDSMWGGLEGAQYPDTGLASATAAIPGAPALQVVMQPVTLKEIATVTETLGEATSVTRINGQPSVTLAVSKEGSANTVTVARRVRDELKSLESEIPGISTVISFDQAEFIEMAINAVTENLLMGAALAILVLILFLKDFRTTFVISISIPFSIIATFVLMYFGNLTLNVMTLGGLTLGVGMLVDNSIVVIENIYRHLEEGKSPREAASIGAREVAVAITASTLTTIVVFLPVVFVGGISGIIFKELAWTVTLSLVASLVVALTVVPMLASQWLSPKLNRAKQGTSTQSVSFPPAKSGGRYKRLVAWCLDHRPLVMAVVAVLVAGSYFLAMNIGTEFLPSTDEGSFSITITMPEGTPLEQTDELVRRIEDILASHESVAMYAVSVGQGDTLASFALSRNVSAEITAAVTPEVLERKATRQVMEEVAAQVNQIKGGAEIVFNLQSTLSTLTGGMEGAVQVYVSGPDINEVQRINDILVEKIKQVHGVKRVSSTLTDKKPELHLVVDRQKALSYGLTPAQVAAAVSRGVSGQTVSRLETDSGTFNVVVRYDRASVNTVEEVSSMLISGPAGTVPLKEIADIREGQGPVAINRIDQRLSASIQAQYSDRKLGEVTDDIAGIIESLDIPHGYRVEIGGMSQIMAESFDSLKLAFVLGAILVYMVMAASFESLITPFVVLFTMPLGAIGAIAALYLSGYAFGITAFIGVIVLVGVIVNNGIVMVDFINQQRAAGLPLGEAICVGAANRLRPVLMTSVTTTLGLVPMALGLGEGAELGAPMALTLMGGLASGTLLTLILVPVVYSVFAGYKPVKGQAGLQQQR